MKKFIFFMILALILCSCSTANSKEMSTYYKLPAVHKTNLDTSLENNSFLYPIKVNSLYGFIDINGNTVIEPKYEKCDGIQKGYYLAYTVDENYTYNENEYTDPYNGTYLIGPGNKVLKLSDKSVYLSILSDKKNAIVYDGNQSYIIDVNSGKVLAKGDETSSIMPAFDDIYTVQDLNSNLYSIKNFNGDVLGEGYTSYDGVNENTIFLKKNDTAYWIDKTGNPFFSYDYCLYPSPFYHDIAPIINYNSQLVFIDKNGNTLSTYDNVTYVYRKNDIYFASTSDGIKIFDINGNRKIDDSSYGTIQYDDPSSDFITSYNSATRNFYVFDKNANLMQNYKIPDGYTDPLLIQDNYIQLTKGTLYGIGIIKDNAVDWLLQPIYSSLYKNEKYIVVYKDSTQSYGLYDLANKKFIFDPYYKNIWAQDENMIQVDSAYFRGYINSASNGEFVYVSPTYDFASDD
ncbi:MAG: WG repeat-containing protein [Oscillospiraceae bacterium]|nr:WG repeat-containing protein [Oscillospiraceae bacterium]